MHGSMRGMSMNGGIENNLGLEKQSSTNRSTNIEKSLPNSNMYNNQTHLSNKPPFQKGVARHICQKFNQNEVSNDIYEVYQYPILKT